MQKINYRKVPVLAHAQTLEDAQITTKCKMHEEVQDHDHFKSNVKLSANIVVAAAVRLQVALQK